MSFEHLRHKPLTELERPRELLVVCPPLRSRVNLSRIVRAASCFGLTRIIACGNTKVDPKITRDGAEHVKIESRRSLGSCASPAARRGLPVGGARAINRLPVALRFRFPAKNRPGPGARARGSGRRRPTVDGPSCRDSGLWPAVQLQRGDCRRNGHVRILPPVSRRVSRHSARVQATTFCGAERLFLAK